MRKILHRCSVIVLLLVLIPVDCFAATDFDMGVCRIGNADRSWAENEGQPTTGWDRSAPFIIAVAVRAAVAVTATIQIRWRDKTDSGSMTALSSSGELTWSATTNLVNGNALVIGERGMVTFGGGYAWVDGLEREGANDASTVIPTKKDETENHWAIDASGADYSHEYEFDVYDLTNTTLIGTCSTETVTMGAEPGGERRVFHLQ